MVRYRAGRLFVPRVLCVVGRYKVYLDMQSGDLVCAFCSGTARPPQPSRANVQRTPDWTPVTTAAETHVPASPSCGVATWARWYQEPETVKLPLWGGPRLHDGGAGAKNASCFFGRTLRNVHFGTLVRRPQIHTFPLRVAHRHFNHQPAFSSHYQPVDQWNNMLHTQSIHSRAERWTDCPCWWHDLT